MILGLLIESGHNVSLPGESDDDNRGQKWPGW